MDQLDNNSQCFYKCNASTKILPCQTQNLYELIEKTFIKWFIVRCFEIRALDILCHLGILVYILLYRKCASTTK